MSQNSNSSASSALAGLWQSSKRKWEALAFDAEMNMSRSTSFTEPTSSDDDFHAQVRNQWDAVVQDSARSIVSMPFIQPWEQGLAAEILGYKSWVPYADNYPQIPRPSILLQDAGNPDLSKVKRAELVGRFDAIPGAWALATHRLAKLDLTAKAVVNSRTIALEKWTRIITSKPEASELGRTLMADLLSFKSDTYLTEVLTDVFSSKAPATLDKRANHLLLFMQFAARKSVAPFPVKPYITMPLRLLFSRSLCLQIWEIPMLIWQILGQYFWKFVQDVRFYHSL